MRLIVLLTAGAFIWLPPAGAQVRRYVDEEGKTHYVDRLEAVPTQHRGQAESTAPLPPISRVEAPRYHPPADRAVPLVAPVKTAEIYVTSWCPHCRSLEIFLQDKGIHYARYDIERDAHGAKIYRKLGGGGIPLVKIGEKVIRGFQPQEILAGL